MIARERQGNDDAVDEFLLRIETLATTMLMIMAMTMLMIAMTMMMMVMMTVMLIMTIAGVARGAA